MDWINNLQASVASQSLRCMRNIWYCSLKSRDLYHRLCVILYGQSIYILPICSSMSIPTLILTLTLTLTILTLTIQYIHIPWHSNLFQHYCDIICMETAGTTLLSHGLAWTSYSSYIKNMYACIQIYIQISKSLNSVQWLFTVVKKHETLTFTVANDNTSQQPW